MRIHRTLALCVIVLSLACRTRMLAPPRDPLVAAAALRLAGEWDAAHALVQRALVEARGAWRGELLVERAAIERELSTYRKTDGLRAARASLDEARPLVGGPARAAWLEEHGRVVYNAALAAGGTLGAARAIFTELRALREAQGDRVGTAMAWFHLGVAHQDDDQLVAARAAFERALPLAEGDLVALGYITRHLGVVTDDRDLRARSLALREQAGHRWGVVTSALLVAADLDDPRRMLEQALGVARGLRMFRSIAQIERALAKHADGASACAHHAAAHAAAVAYGDPSLAPKVACPGPAAPADAVRVAVAPSPARLEVTDTAQLAQWDLVVTNSAPVEWRLVAFEVAAFDRAGVLVSRRTLDRSGVRPSLDVVVANRVAADAQALIFNPLPELPVDADIARVRFALELARTDGSTQHVSATVEVAPVRFTPAVRHELPLRGRMLVWDGHELLAHHRRWDYLARPLRALGFTTNAGRYSYDLVPVDRDGRMSGGDPAVNASWLGFGAPVHATAAGTVVVADATHPDDRTMHGLSPDNRIAAYGNVVVIDHGGGEYGLFAHLQQGSLRVKIGDRVRAGDVIAAIGASGSSKFPHLHYQLQTAPHADAEGLPVTFHQFTRIRGLAKRLVRRSVLTSGDILEAGTP